ncbi:4430_t:CDS:2, partial [Funneliformis mosseae]
MDGNIDERYDKIIYFNFSILLKDQCNDLQTASFEKVLNDDLFVELRYIYKEELGCIEHFTSQTIKYFNSISYIIVNNDDRVDVNLCVSDTVDVLEDISNDTLNNPKT